MKRAMPSEHAEQKALFQWVELQYGKYPELKLLYAIPNGGKRHVVTAMKMKAEGVRPGVPDIHLPVPRNGFSGLWIEMKRKGSKPTPAQMDWATALSFYGHKWRLCYSWREAGAEIEEYLK